MFLLEKILPHESLRRSHGTRRYSIDANSRNAKLRITFAWANDELTDVKRVEIQDTHP